MRERFSRLHAPGPAWAALTGQLRFEEEVETVVSDVAVIGGEVAMPRLLEGPTDA